MHNELQHQGIYSFATAFAKTFAVCRLYVDAGYLPGKVGDRGGGLNVFHVVGSVNPA